MRSLKAGRSRAIAREIKRQIRGSFRGVPHIAEVVPAFFV